VSSLVWETQRYISPTQYEHFLVENFKLDRAIFLRELKKPPRAVVWPFGRYSDLTLNIAKRAGYQFSLTLDPEPSDAADLMRIARYLPTRDPKLGDEIEYLKFQDRLPTVQRLACLNPAELISDDAKEFDRRLGVVIERAREIGVTNVLIPAAFVDHNQKVQSWFPNSVTHVQSDYLSRLVWQIRTRAGVAPTVSIPLKEMQDAGMTDEQIQQWFQDLGRMVPVQSLLFNDLNHFENPRLPASKAEINGFWQTRKVRNLLDLTALPAYERQALKGIWQVDQYRPNVQVFTIKSGLDRFSVSDAIDLTLFKTSFQVNAFSATLQNIDRAGLLTTESVRRRVGVWLSDSMPPDSASLKEASLYFQANKGTALGWCPNLWLENIPNAQEVSPAVSAARFPLKP
jgi:hypothetical protein